MAASGFALRQEDQELRRMNRAFDLLGCSYAIKLAHFQAHDFMILGKCTVVQNMQTFFHSKRNLVSVRLQSLFLPRPCPVSNPWSAVPLSQIGFFQKVHINGIIQCAACFVASFALQNVVRAPQRCASRQSALTPPAAEDFTVWAFGVCSHQLVDVWIFFSPSLGLL